MLAIEDCELVTALSRKYCGRCRKKHQNVSGSVPWPTFWAGIPRPLALRTAKHKLLWGWRSICSDIFKTTRVSTQTTHVHITWDHVHPCFVISPHRHLLLFLSYNVGASIFLTFIYICCLMMW